MLTPVDRMLKVSSMDLLVQKIFNDIILSVELIILFAAHNEVFAFGLSKYLPVLNPMTCRMRRH